MKAKFDISPYLKVFTSRRIAIITFLGFSSGLPLALTGGTMQAWMAVSGVDLRTIGIFALVGLPYTLKFFWSPLMDRFVPPWLGRRRGWILITQLCLAIGVVAMAFSSPQQAPLFLAVLALIVLHLAALPDTTAPASAPRRARSKGFVAAALAAGLLLGLGLGWTAWQWGRSEPAPRVVSLAMALPGQATFAAPNRPGGGSSVAISRDGRNVAYVSLRNGKQQLVPRRLDRSEEIELPGAVFHVLDADHRRIYRLAMKLEHRGAR